MKTPNPFAAPSGGGGGNNNAQAMMMSSAMKFLPYLVSVMNRGPAIAAGFLVGLVWWIFVVPLATSTVFPNPVETTGEVGGLSASSLLSFFTSGGSSSNAAEEWDADLPSGSSKGGNSNAKMMMRDDDEAVDIEDGDDSNSGGTNARMATTTTTTSFFFLLTDCLYRGTSSQQESLLRCMHKTNSLLGQSMIVLVLIAFVSSGATQFYRRVVDEKVQHQRAMDIVEDVFMGERMASMD